MIYLKISSILLLLLIMNTSLGVVKTIRWAQTLVELKHMKSSLTRTLNKTAKTGVLCAMLTSETPWTNSFCYEQQQCLMASLKLPISKNKTVFHNPVSCFTYLGEMKSFKCDGQRNDGTLLPCYEKGIKDTWQNGRNDCRKRGMDYVVDEDITTVEEIKHLKKVLNIENKNFWIGALSLKGQESNEPDYEWIDGKAFDMDDPRVPDFGDTKFKPFWFISKETNLFQAGSPDTTRFAVCKGSLHPV